MLDLGWQKWKKAGSLFNLTLITTSPQYSQLFFFSNMVSSSSSKLSWPVAWQHCGWLEWDQDSHITSNPPPTHHAVQCLLVLNAHAACGTFSCLFVVTLSPSALFYCMFPRGTENPSSRLSLYVRPSRYFWHCHLLCIDWTADEWRDSYLRRLEMEV